MAYNNTIELAASYLPILDDVYKASSKTAILDTANERVRFIGADTINLYTMSMDGLGDYSRNAGFVTGSVVGAWEPFKLTQDRGRSFMVDVMDNDETLGMAFGNLAGEFIRTQVTPEIDAYRFAKYAGTSGISAATPADVTVGTTDIAALIQTAETKLGDDEVPEEGRILFISEAGYAALKDNISRFVQNGERGIDTAIVVNEVPVSFEFDDSLMIGIGISSNLIQDTFIFPGASNTTAHCIADLLRKFRSVREIIPVSTLMNPRCFGESRQMYRNNGTVQFNHILFQFGVITLGVSPIKIRLTVVVYENCRINVIPPDFGIFGSHVVGDQC